MPTYGDGTYGSGTYGDLGGGGTTLTVADTAHEHTTENVVLTQVHVLTVDDSSHSHTTENVVLTGDITLVVADTAHGHTSDHVTLSGVSVTFRTKVWRPPAMTLVENIVSTDDPNDPRTFDEFHEVQDNELGRFGFSTFDVDGLDIQPGDFVAFYQDEVCLGGGWIRVRHTVRVSRNSEGKVVHQWSGARPISIFESGKIRPARGLGSTALDRAWGWFGISFDYSAFGFATEIASVDNSTHHWQYVLGDDPLDPAFEDLTAFFIWDSSGTDEFAATGDCYFWDTATVPVGTTEVEIQMVADAQADMYIEGQRQVTTDYIYGDPKPENIKRVRVSVDAGPIRIAVKAVNNPDYDFDGNHNPAGVAAAIWALDPATGEKGTLLWHTDSSVKILAYPATPPGVTIGEVFLELLDEFQGAGYFPWITATFTTTHDSANQPWAETAEVGTKCGYSMWKLVQQCIEVFVDADVDPDTHEWNVWNKGTRGVDTDVVFEATDDPATSNVTEWIETEVLQVGNQILHYSRQGWWVTSAIFDGLKIDATLGLGALESFPAVQRYAEAQLEQSSQNLVEHDVAIEPTGVGDTPVYAFDIGDRVTIGGELQRVVQMGWRRDENGRIHWDADEAVAPPLQGMTR